MIAREVIALDQAKAADHAGNIDRPERAAVDVQRIGIVVQRAGDRRPKAGVALELAPERADLGVRAASLRSALPARVRGLATGRVAARRSNEIMGRLSDASSAQCRNAAPMWAPEIIFTYGFSVSAASPPVGHSNRSSGRNGSRANGRRIHKENISVYTTFYRTVDHPDRASPVLVRAQAPGQFGRGGFREEGAARRSRELGRRRGKDPSPRAEIPQIRSDETPTRRARGSQNRALQLRRFGAYARPPQCQRA